LRGIDAYTEQHRNGIQNELSADHAALVIKIAKHLIRKLPSSIEINDLIQSGFVGLLEAQQKYKDDQGASFDTFASIRIKGAMIDELRKNSWSNRQISKEARRIAEATNKIEQQFHRPATSKDIIEELDITLDEYNHACLKINLSNVINIEDVEQYPLNSKIEENPENDVDMNNQIVDLKKRLEKLSEREQILLSLYYIEELTLREVGEVLELTEARVCQIHAGLLAKLKTSL